MSIHGSLKTKPSGLNAHRNVLTRAERIAQLSEKERFKSGQSPLGLVKVANRMVVASKKKKEAEGAEGAAAPGAAPAAGAAAKPAAGAAAKPAAVGAKPAAAAKPAAKK